MYPHQQPHPNQNHPAHPYPPQHAPGYHYPHAPHPGQHVPHPGPHGPHTAAYSHHYPPHAPYGYAGQPYHPPQQPYYQYPPHHAAAAAPSSPHSAASAAHWTPSAADLHTLTTWFNSLATITSSGATISGPAAVTLLQASQLPRDTLRHIWSLVDVANRGYIDKQQFLITMRLVSIAQHPKYAAMPLSMQLYQHTIQETLPLAKLTGYADPSTTSTISTNTAPPVSTLPPANPPQVEDEWGDFAAPSAGNSAAEMPNDNTPIPTVNSISNLSDLTEATPNATSAVMHDEEDDFGEFAAPTTSRPAPPNAHVATPEKKKVDITSLLASITADPLNTHAATLSQELQQLQSMKSSDSHDIRYSMSGEVSVGSNTKPVDPSALDRLAALDELAELDLMAEKEEWDEFTDHSKPPPAAVTESINPFDAYVASDAVAPDNSNVERPRLESEDFGDFADASNVPSDVHTQPLHSEDFRDFPQSDAKIITDVAIAESSDRPRLPDDDFGDFSQTASIPNSGKFDEFATSARPHLASDDFGDFSGAVISSTPAAGGDNDNSSKDPWDDISVTDVSAQNVASDEMISFGDFDQSDIPPAAKPPVDEVISFGDFEQHPFNVANQSSLPSNHEEDEFGDFEQGSATSNTEASFSNFDNAATSALPPLPPTTTSISSFVPKTESIQSASSMSNLSVVSNDSDPFAELSAQVDSTLPALASPIVSDDFGNFSSSIPSTAPTRKPSVCAIYPDSKPSDSKSLLQQVQLQRGLSHSPADDDSQTSIHLPAPSEHRNLSAEELDAVVSALVQLNQLPEAYHCLKQATAARKVKELNIKKMEAVENDNLELAIQYRDEIAKLKESLATRDDEMRWLRLATEGGSCESLADIVEILTAIDEPAGALARVKYISSHPTSAGATTVSQLLYLVEARRCLQLAIAVRTSHTEYVSKWTQILRTVKSCLVSASQHISQYLHLSAADQAALTIEGKMNIFLRGLARIMEVGIWVCASCVEALVAEELCNEVLQLIKQVRQAEESLHMTHEFQYPLPNLEELSHQAAELVGCSNVTYCNLTLRPVAVTVMKDNIGREKRVSGAAYAEYAGVPYMQAIICLWAHHFPDVQPPIDSIHFV